MALPVTSGTASFLVSRDDIITEGLQNLKVIPVDAIPSSSDITKCARTLNMILKELDTAGYLKWVYQAITFPMIAGKTSYTVAETGADVTAFNPVKVARAQRQDSATPPNITPLTYLSRQAWDQLTPKILAAPPTNFYWDPQIDKGIFYPWPQPSDGTYSAILTAQRPIQDITLSTQNFDVPQEWFLTLAWILADEVSHAYEVDLDTIDRVQKRAQMKRDKLENFSMEDASIIFGIDPQPGFGGSRFNN